MQRRWQPMPDRVGVELISWTASALWLKPQTLRILAPMLVEAKGFCSRPCRFAKQSASRQSPAAAPPWTSNSPILEVPNIFPDQASMVPDSGRA